jgi:hypothetical protein
VSPRRKPQNDRNARGGKGGASGSDERNIEEVGLSFQSVEEHSDGFYQVRRITGSSSTKPYRCPGCDQLIPTATPHVVAWPEEDIESRRHWHTPCWKKKDQRKPRIERTRNAPKF